MMEEGSPHFIELKSYMNIGMSTMRLERSNMMEMDEVRNFADRLCSKLHGYSVMDESEISKIVVIQNNERYTDRWIKSYLT
jgi:tRNA wybutosine-synthesizing protein 1